MKEIDVNQIKEAIIEMAGKIACVYHQDILQAIQESAKKKQMKDQKL